MLTVLIGALVIGLALGMFGSGGSAITVPVLIYLVGHGAKESIAESMAIVGSISVFAAIPYAKSNQIDWRSVWCFGLPGMVGTFAGAWLGGIASEALQLTVFGGVLFVAAYMMLRQPPGDASSDEEASGVHRSAIWQIALEGSAVGVVTGFVGVGGGFLIVPALVLLARLPMRLAIGTSLVIIAFKAAIGFAKYEHYLITHEMSVDPQTIAAFTIIGVAGSFAGRIINTRMDQERLKQGFAVFLILMGVFVIIQEGSKYLKAHKPMSSQSESRGQVYCSSDTTGPVEPVSAQQVEKNRQEANRGVESRTRIEFPSQQKLQF